MNEFTYVPDYRDWDNWSHNMFRIVHVLHLEPPTSSVIAQSMNIHPGPTSYTYAHI